MKGAGYYKQAINQNNAGISAALEHIPAKGVVRRTDFEAYVPSSPLRSTAPA